MLILLHEFHHKSVASQVGYILREDIFFYIHTDDMLLLCPLSFFVFISRLIVYGLPLKKDK